MNRLSAKLSKFRCKLASGPAFAPSAAPRRSVQDAPVRSVDPRAARLVRSEINAHQSRSSHLYCLEGRQLVHYHKDEKHLIDSRKISLNQDFVLSVIGRHKMISKPYFLIYNTSSGISRNASGSSTPSSSLESSSSGLVAAFWHETPAQRPHMLEHLRPDL